MKRALSTRQIGSSSFILSLSSVVGESVLNFGAIVGAMFIGSGETLVIQQLPMTLWSGWFADWTENLDKEAKQSD